MQLSITGFFDVSERPYTIKIDLSDRLFYEIKNAVADDFELHANLKQRQVHLRANKSVTNVTKNARKLFAVNKKLLRNMQTKHYELLEVHRV